MKTLLTFKTRVIIKCSGEKGEIIGRSEYLGGLTQYLIRYQNNAGVAVEQWWAEDSIECVEAD